MNNEKKLAKNVGIFALGSMGSKLITYLMVPLYSYYILPADYGVIDAVQTVINLMVPLVTMEFCEATFRFVKNKDDDKQTIFTNSFIACLVAILITAIAVYALDSHYWFGESYLIFIGVMAFSIITNLFKCFLRGLSRSVDFVLNDFVITFTMALFNIIFLVGLHMDINGYFLSIMIANICGCLFVTFKSKIFSYFNIKKFSKAKFLEMLKYSAPLIPNYIGLWIMNLSDRFIIRAVLGEEANGIYGMSAKIPSLLKVVSNIFFQAFNISAVDAYEEGNNEKFFSKMLKINFTILITGVSAILLVLRPFLLLYLSPEYRESWLYVPFLLIGMIFAILGTFFGTFYVAEKKTMGVFVSSAIGAILNIIINVSLISVIGIQAASLSTMLAFLAMLIYRMYDTRKFIKLKIEWHKIILSFILIGIQVALLYTQSIILNIASTGILAAIIYINRDIIIEVCKSAKGLIKGKLSKKKGRKE